MPRPTCKRRIGFQPKAVFFKPAGIPLGVVQEIVIGHDEVEAMRLKNLLGYPQEEAANQMGVSQPTFHRLINAAHQKITDAIINGKALRIDGGNVTINEETVGPCHWRKHWGRGCSSAEAVASQVSLTQEERGGIPMKVAITSIDGTLDGMVDERFGRAKKIVVVDDGTNSQEAVDNVTNMNAAQGAGIQTAQNVIQAGAKAVISGHLGPNAFRVLSTAGVEVYTASGMTVRDALEAYKAGKLPKLTGADVEGHW
ncbi:MAG TPA: DUF134 domain-containing protein [Syntrophorhabdaceae bacterium]|nr:DUF134 domain-containing protein [Syntrophorhabdaceae bacterium]